MSLSLLEDTTVALDGVGPAVRLSWEPGNLLVLTLVISRIVEREAVLVSLWGSADGTDWGVSPLVSFSPKYYCGTYSVLLNLAARGDIRYLRVHWHLKRSQRKAEYPTVCEFCVYAEASGSRLSAVA